MDFAQLYCPVAFSNFFACLFFFFNKKENFSFEDTQKNNARIHTIIRFPWIR